MPACSTLSKKEWFYTYKIIPKVKYHLKSYYFSTARLFLV